MLRVVLGTLAGIATAILTVAAGEAIGHAIFPPPTGVDFSKSGALAAVIDKLPTGAFGTILIAWAAGSFAGGAMAAHLARRAWTAWTVGATMLVAATAMMMMLPHPTWFVFASVPAALLPAWAAGRMFTPRTAAREVI